MSNKLENITRVTGDIPPNHGILMLQYDTWYVGEDDVELKIILSTTDDIIKLAHTSSNPSFKPKEKPFLNTITKRPYPNKNYISLAYKNGRRQYKTGIPFVAKLEELNKIDTIKIIMQSKGLKIYRLFEFPVSIKMTKEKPYARISIKDFTYINDEYDYLRMNIKDEQFRLYPALTINIPLSNQKGGYTEKKWAWSYHYESNAHVKNYFSNHHIYKDTTWLTHPDESHDLMLDDGSIFTDSLYLGRYFYPHHPDDINHQLPNNIVTIKGSSDYRILDKH